MYRLLHHALRQLRQRPGFAATAILTLAIGIGAPAAIFAVLDAVLLNPLPFAQPNRLVAVDAQPDATLSIPTMLDYQSRSNTFVGLAAYRQWSPAQKADETLSLRLASSSLLLCRFCAVLILAGATREFDLGHQSRTARGANLTHAPPQTASSDLPMTNSYAGLGFC